MMSEKIQSKRSAKQRYISLATCCFVIAIVMLVVFPMLAERPTVRARIDYLESLGIDSTAMFYTELDAMEGVLDRMEKFHKEHPDALWFPGLVSKSALNRSSSE